MTAEAEPQPPEPISQFESAKAIHPASSRRTGTEPKGVAESAVELIFNPWLPEIHANPYPVYRRLREEDPVHQPFPGVWILSRHRDVAALFRHPGMSSDRRNSPVYEEFIKALPVEPDEGALTPSMLFLDPPDHDRLRRLANKAFTPRAVDRLVPRIHQVVDQLLDRAREMGSFDVVADLAYPLPVTVISEMLGVPEADRDRLRAWSLDLIYTLDPMLSVEALARAQRAGAEFRAYLRELIADRRGHLGDDLLSGLIQAEDDGQQLTMNELVATCVLLLVAGHETTSSFIGNGMLALLRNPDQYARLHEDPGLMRNAGEELLRYESPVQLTGRLVLRDTEIAGQRIEAGQDVVALVGAANRDPEVFAEPDRLDVGRVDNRHVAFGGGIHFCLGAPLARMEGGAAIAALATRFPSLELATDHPQWRDTITLRALSALPVAAR
jgi:pimeloyl-[acyl-carrier protein] synthase